MNKISDGHVIIPSANQNEEYMAKNRILGISPEDTANHIDLFTCFQGENTQ